MGYKSCLLDFRCTGCSFNFCRSDSLSLAGYKSFAEIDKGFEQHLQFCNRGGELDKTLELISDALERVEVVRIRCSNNVAEENEKRGQGMIEDSPGTVSRLKAS